MELERSQGTEVLSLCEAYVHCRNIYCSLSQEDLDVPFTMFIGWMFKTRRLQLSKQEPLSVI